MKKLCRIAVIVVLSMFTCTLVVSANGTLAETPEDVINEMVAMVKSGQYDGARKYVTFPFAVLVTLTGGPEEMEKMALGGRKIEWVEIVNKTQIKKKKP